MLFILILGSLVILVLAGVAIYYSLAWRKRKRELRIHYEEQESILDGKRGDAKRGIRLIASAYLQGQVSCTEMAMRISYLSKAIDINEEQQEVLQIFDKLASETAHIPILDEWRKLSRKQQWQFDQSRFKVEEKYKDFVQSSAEKLVSEDFFNTKSNDLPLWK